MGCNIFYQEEKPKINLIIQEKIVYTKFSAYSDIILKNVSETQLTFINFITFYSILFDIRKPDYLYDILDFFVFHYSSPAYNNYFLLNDFDIFLNKLFSSSELQFFESNPDEKLLLTEELYYIYFELKKLSFEYSDNNNIFIMRKYYCIALGFIFCRGPIIDKIEFLFQTFSNNKLFSKNKKFEEFLIITFIIGSYCLLSYKSNISYESFKQEYDIYFQTFEISNIKKLCEAFINNFFFEKESYNEEEFIEKYKNENFQWIFSSSGIRYELEMNNNNLKKQLKKVMNKNTS